MFLQRIWGEQPLEARSWVVDPASIVVERELWEHFGVNVVEEPLDGVPATSWSDELGVLAGAPAER